MDLADQLARATLERLPAETARMWRRNTYTVAGNGAVGCDDSVEFELESGIADSKQIVAFQVRRDLEQNRRPMQRIANTLGHRVEDLAHLLRRLPSAKPRRIRRADVDHDEVRERAHPRHQRCVIRGDTSRRRAFVGPEVERKANRNPGLLDPLDSVRNRLHPFARKAETVYQRPALADAPKPW